MGTPGSGDPSRARMFEQRIQFELFRNVDTRMLGGDHGACKVDPDGARCTWRTSTTCSASPNTTDLADAFSRLSQRSGSETKKARPLEEAGLQSKLVKRHLFLCRCKRPPLGWFGGCVGAERVVLNRFERSVASLGGVPKPQEVQQVVRLDEAVAVQVACGMTTSPSTLATGS